MKSVTVGLPWNTRRLYSVLPDSVYRLPIPRHRTLPSRTLQINPKQVSYLSNDKLGNVLVEDQSSLRILTIPKQITDSRGVPSFDLSKGYEKFESCALSRDVPKLNDILKTVQHVESREGKRVKVDFITSRGVLMDIAISPYLRLPFELNISCIDGQIFMSSNNYRDEVFTEEIALKSIFSGFKFESIMTAPLMGETATTDENGTTEVINNLQTFKTLVHLDIGLNPILFGAEVDAYLRSDGLQLSNYVELKAMIGERGKAMKLRKLYVALMQCALIGTPVIIIGTRNLQFQLESIKILKVAELLESNKFKGIQYNMQMSLQWLEKTLDWIRQSVDFSEDKLWRLIRRNEDAFNFQLLEYRDEKDVKKIRAMVIGDEFQNFRQKL